MRSTHFLNEKNSKAEWLPGIQVTCGGSPHGRTARIVGASDGAWRRTWAGLASVWEWGDGLA